MNLPNFRMFITQTPKCHSRKAQKTGEISLIPFSISLSDSASNGASRFHPSGGIKSSQSYSDLVSFIEVN